MCFDGWVLSAPGIIEEIKSIVLAVSIHSAVFFSLRIGMVRSVRGVFRSKDTGFYGCSLFKRPASYLGNLSYFILRRNIVCKIISGNFLMYVT